MNLQDFLVTLESRGVEESARTEFSSFYSKGIEEDADNFPSENTEEEWNEQYASWQALDDSDNVEDDAADEEESSEVESSSDSEETSEAA